jgi:hypothetical protein
MKDEDRRMTANQQEIPSYQLLPSDFILLPSAFRLPPHTGHLRSRLAAIGLAVDFTSYLRHVRR